MTKCWKKYKYILRKLINKHKCQSEGMLNFLKFLEWALLEQEYLFTATVLYRFYFVTILRITLNKEDFEKIYRKFSKFC